jgi:hypothetical protein
MFFRERFHTLVKGVSADHLNRVNNLILDQP